MSTMRARHTGNGEWKQGFLVDQPAPWLARSVSYLLITVFLATLLGSIFIQIPEVVECPFHLVPRGGSDPVRAPRDGFIAEVHLADAQPVKQGEPLYIIRSHEVGDRSSELATLKVQRVGAQESLAIAARKHRSQDMADQEEIRKLKDRSETLTQKIAGTKRVHALQEESERLNLTVAEQEIDSLSRELTYRQKVQRVAAEIALKSAKLHDTHSLSDLENLRIQLEVDRTRLEVHQAERLLSASQMKLKQLQADHQSHQTDRTIALNQLENDLHENEETLAKLRYEHDAGTQAYQELIRGLKETVEQSGIRIAGLQEQLRQSQGQTVAVPAPCTGTVLRLVVKAEGTFVRMGDILCELAATGKELQAELAMPQAGIGRIKPGQSVRLRYDAFPYQRYGVRYGTVRWASPTTTLVEDVPAYRVLVGIDQGTVLVDGTPRPLKAGMSGGADIIVGKRSLISHIFEPFRQLRENLGSEPPAEHD